MSHVLHVTCHKCYMLQILSCQEFYQRPHVLYIFGKLLQNPVQWACKKRHMSQMLHVTTIKFPGKYHRPHVLYIIRKLVQNQVE